MKNDFDGKLGVTYSHEASTFRLFAPSADAVALCLYERGDGDCLLSRTPMRRGQCGTWSVKKESDLNHIYYTYQITRAGTVQETADMYAVAAGVNGVRSMVANLRETDPPGFASDRGPGYKNKTDLIICEISIADTTGDESAGVLHAGKFLGLAEEGSVSPDGYATGLDHLKSLGITHVQIMPFFDFASIDERMDCAPQYNWGYDPLNYNVPEGSYSTDPYHGQVRIRELKQMIMAFHAAGIGVIMDVVYNHTFDVEHSSFQKSEPDYFYRKKDGVYSNGSGCGNEVATEREMARRFLVDSVCYWASEYHVDGFRFDLMGAIDIRTMNEISERLHEINADIILYGEGWTGGESALAQSERAIKKNVRMLRGIGAFSDDIRDTIKGSVFDERGKGFVNGGKNLENGVRYAVTGGVWHPQVDYESYFFTAGGPWTESPENTINYVSCHDNLTLWDKLARSCPKSGRQTRLAMNRLAAAIVFTSQGVPFFLQGEEFGRSKPTADGGVSHNSYNLPLAVNSLKYGLLSENRALFDYYRGLIAFRREHPALRLATAQEIRECVRFLENLPRGVVAFTISHTSETLFVVYNAGRKGVQIELPEGKWNLFIDKNRAKTAPMQTVESVFVAPSISCTVFVRL